jgi:hypothetical protein
MKIKQTDLITVPLSRKPGHCHFLGGSDARVSISLDEGCRDPTTADRRSQPCSRRQIANGAGSALAAPSGQALASYYPETTADRCKTTDFHEWYPELHESVRHSAAKTLRRFSEHTFDQGNRVLVSRVATDLDIRDRIS